jgi:ABC transport system ATP-binding/permease protein
MAVLLGCQSLGKSFGSRPLFEGLTFVLNDGEHTGLIGPNGSGKTTLLNLLAGLEKPDEGTLSVKRQLRLGYVPQRDSFEPHVNAEQILTAALTDDHLDEHTREYRVAAVLTRIGFPDDWRRAPVEALSGGWRKRVAIARELVREPELLLMDEPTNHLDLDGILWLEQLLADAPFGSLVVSHDRLFLEHTANRIFELNRCFPGGFFSTPGHYSDFLEKREEFLCGQLKTQQALESVVRREAEWLRRGAPARRTKARARVDEAGRLIGELAEVRTRNEHKGGAGIDFAATGRQANKLITLKGIEKSLGERKLIGGLDLVLTRGMKLGLLGGNGSGKTTFLRLLAGELEPDAGTIERAERLQAAYFDQQREQLDPEATLRRALAPTGESVSFRGQPTHVSGWAKRFLFKPEQLDMQVKDLSGGEQARILIARLMLRPADILLLDEPTNDLDIPSLEVLEESLADFPGVLVLVTHDRVLLRKLATDILGLDGCGGVRLFADFAQWENDRRQTIEREIQARKPSPVKPAQRAEPTRSAKRLSFKDQREWNGMETAILESEAAAQAIQKEIEDPAIARDPMKLRERCQALAEAQAQVDRLYTRWKELEEKQR